MSVAGARVLRAAAVLVAAVASFLVTYAACRWAGAQPGPAILAVVLVISLSRRPSPVREHGFVAYATLACVALLAAGVGRLLHALPAVGAVVFVGLLSVSVWLRNFGVRARTLGTMIALPLIAILIVPVDVRAPGGPLVDLALVLAAGALALTIVTVEQSIATRLGIVEDAADVITSAAAERTERTKAAERAQRTDASRSIAASEQTAMPERAKRSRLSPATRMALQMAAALASAFVAGMLVFPGHWGWVVLTAFIVCSGARGRGDALYKGVLRLAGAVAGTLGAAALAHVWAPSGTAEAVLIFAALFAGVCLRDVNYAYWAGCMTLVLALLSSGGNELNVGLLELRLAAILVGAACGVAAAWFVTPIRTRDVVRRRLLDALAALDDLLAQDDPDPAQRERLLAVFDRRLRDVEAVATPVRWHRRVAPGARAGDAEHPAGWIELVHALSGDAASLAANPNVGARTRGTLRRTLGVSRRALARRDGAPDERTVSASLRAVHDAVRESMPNTAAVASQR